MQAAFSLRQSASAGMLARAMKNPTAKTERVTLRMLGHSRAGADPDRKPRDIFTHVEMNRD